MWTVRTTQVFPPPDIAPPRTLAHPTSYHLLTCSRGTQKTQTQQQQVVRPYVCTRDTALKQKARARSARTVHGVRATRHVAAVRATYV
jgi:hypothetical protein